ncbi:hypothetical protein, partial [Ferrovibrio terrae]|uniref:hypothetical protein n=1 Tax=Ferrovibrio terrae TaxID=2594003 RepID=UPI0031381E5D
LTRASIPTIGASGLSVMALTHRQMDARVKPGHDGVGVVGEGVPQPSTVMPAKAGIQQTERLGSRFRGSDGFS